MGVLHSGSSRSLGSRRGAGGGSGRALFAVHTRARGVHTPLLMIELALSAIRTRLIKIEDGLLLIQRGLIRFLGIHPLISAPSDSGRPR